MMKRLGAPTLAAALLFLPALAFAQEETSLQEGPGLEGVYVGAYAGAGFLGEQDVDTDSLLLGVGIESDTKIEYDPGIRFGGYVGYNVATNIRVQLDVSYLSTEGDNELEIGNNDSNFDQDTTILAGTAAVFFDLWPIGVAVPYVGAGAGLAQVKTNNKDLDNDLGDSDQTVLTVFGEAGVPFNLTPGLAIVPALRFAWYNTEEETENVVLQEGLNEAEVAAIGDSLYETQLLVHARYSF